MIRGKRDGLRAAVVAVAFAVGVIAVVAVVVVVEDGGVLAWITSGICTCVLTCKEWGLRMQITATCIT